MLHDLDLIFTITGGLTVALLLGLLTQRVGLSPIVGYLLAGIVVGRYTPGFVADAALADQLAEIGVILLMFGVGLQFHLDELLAVKGVAVPGAIVQIMVATGLGVLVSHSFGWDLPAGIIFGLSISVASTVVLTRVLADNDELHTQTGHIAIGWLVVEDLFTVLVLVLIPAIVGGSHKASDSDHSSSGALLTVAIALGKIVLLVASAFLFGRRLIPFFLGRVAATRSRELFTLAVLVIALGIAVGSAKLFGASMALGAFLAGMIVNQSAYSHRAAVEALPMRDAFAVLFFVSIGMLFNPWKIQEDWPMIFVTTFVIIVGKPIAALIVVRILRYPFRAAIAVSIALAQIGEFSFVLARLGKDLNLLPESGLNVLVAASILSIMANPILFRFAKPIAALVARNRWATLLLEGSNVAKPLEANEPIVDAYHKAVVVGYGPVGQLVVHLLRECGIVPTVIELNPKTIVSLRNQGINAIYGDASHGDTLSEAGIKTTNNLILTASEVSNASELIAGAKSLNPALHVVARTEYIKNRQRLVDAGAEKVFSGEGEVALAIADFLLEKIEAPDGQREELRRSVFESLRIGRDGA
jgi:CPA2 family monovalent cation:H+ antiporter-2